MPKRRIGILTGGGDVPPLNAVLAAAQAAAIKRNLELLGFLNGWQGVLDGRFVTLSRVKLNPLIGGTVLRSSRVNLGHGPDRITRVRQVIEQHRIEGLIVVGGEDTLSNALHLRDVPQVLISKTIDNDVGAMPKGREIAFPDIVNYFTLGFPTASRKISSFVSLKEGLRTTAYSHRRIILLESMGMHAGWLALSAALGHPDLIILPEFPLKYESFKGKVIKRYGKQKNLIIVIAEGARWDNGTYISTVEGEEDDFGHPRFRGAAESLARRLKEDLKQYFDTRNVNFVNPSYLYRSGAPCGLDLEWAGRLGREAVKLLASHPGGSICLAIRRYEEKFALCPRSVADVRSIEQLHRFVDDRFYDPRRMSITAAGREYLRCIAEDIPEEEYGLKD